MVYICGDNERFNRLEEAILHASKMFRRAGNVIAIEAESPLESVCARYGLSVPRHNHDEAWKLLALALMRTNGHI